MSKKDFSVNGALVGGMAGWVAEVAIQEVTGHHVTTGILEILGAAAGTQCLDRRLTRSLTDTPARAQDGPGRDYQEVKRRIEELELGTCRSCGRSWATWWTRASRPSRPETMFALPRKSKSPLCSRGAGGF